MEDPRERSQEVLEAARVGRAHGLDGSFYVTGPLTRLLTLGATVTVGGRRAEVVRRAGTEKRPIIRLDCVADRAAAEALRGAALTVAQADAPALGEGEWWAHELEGCAVVDDQGRTLGAVTRLIGLPSCEVLEVARDGAGQPLLVPMVKDAIREIDVAGRRVHVDATFLGIEIEPGGRDGD
ncbi:MAG TPA: ribosome maturation factor RimM [Solirubrobacteraceae bacterium]